MYNGIGLQTARGSGTNGYIQTNKFFVRPKSNKLEAKGFDSNQGTAGLSKKPNKDILEHDRKRQIQLKLVVLEDKLIDQGYTDEEVAVKVDEARRVLEAADKAERESGVSAIVVHDKRVSDTQTHQIAARKEKQMETLKSALGISSPGKNQKKPGNHSDDEESNDDEKLETVPKNRNNASVPFLARDALNEKDDSEKGLKDEDVVQRDRTRISKLQKKNSSSDTDSDSSQEHVKKMSKKKYEKIRASHRDDSSSDSDSDSGSGGGHAKRNRKKHHNTRQSSDSDDKSDSGVRNVSRKSLPKHKKSRRHDSDDSDSDSDSGSGGRHATRNRKKHHNTRQSSDSDDKSDPGVRSVSRKLSQKHKKSRRHDSDDSDYADEIDDKSRWRGGIDNERYRPDETPERVPDKAKLVSRSRQSDSEYDSDSDSREDYKKKQVESRNAGYKEEYKRKQVELRNAGKSDSIPGGDGRKIRDEQDHKDSCAGVCRNWREIVKEIVKTPEVARMLTFPISLKQPGPRDHLIQCFIRRDRNTQTYSLYLCGQQASNDNGKFLLAARKVRRPTCTDYIITLTSKDTSRANSIYIGKLRSNFLGTKFTIYDAQPPNAGALVKCHSSRVGMRQVSPRVPAGNYPISHISYELNVLGSRGPRRMHCVMDAIPASAIEPGGVAPTQTEFVRNVDSFPSLPFFRSKSISGSLSTEKDGILMLKNKAPRWHEQLQCWCLNFNGRVTVASVKNFQLVACVDSGAAGLEPENVVLQFGKVGKDVFTMDYQYPISAFQAFAICLSSFDTKIACE